MQEIKKAHVVVKQSAKEKLTKIKKREGYASIEIVIDKLLLKHGDKKL